MKSMRALRNIFWFIIATWLFWVGNAYAADSATGGPSASPPPVDFVLESPLKESIGGIDTLVKVVINDIVLPLGVSVAAVFIIYSGFLYIKAQGNPSELGNAHKALTWTLVGTAILLGAWALAQLIGGTIDTLRTP